jgi:hypothetical protein
MGKNKINESAHTPPLRIGIMNLIYFQIGGPTLEMAEMAATSSDKQSEYAGCKSKYPALF